MIRRSGRQAELSPFWRHPGREGGRQGWLPPVNPEAWLAPVMSGREKLHPLVEDVYNTWTAAQRKEAADHGCLIAVEGGEAEPESLTAAADAEDRGPLVRYRPAGEWDVAGTRNAELPLRAEYDEGVLFGGRGALPTPATTPSATRVPSVEPENVDVLPTPPPTDFTASRNGAARQRRPRKREWFQHAWWWRRAATT